MEPSLTENVITENEMLSSLENWGIWRYREDSYTGNTLHKLYRMMLEFGQNPMREVKSKKNIDEEEALLMQRILNHMQRAKNRELWYEVLYETYVMHRNKEEVAKELGCCQRTVRRKLNLAIGWLCDNSRMFFDIWDLEKELIS